MTVGIKSPLSVSRPGPLVTCRRLPAYDAGDLAAVRRAFAAASLCDLGQAWQASVSAHFAPGRIRVGWREDTLLVFAELTDQDVFTRATAPNQRMWELGDALEIFLRPDRQTAYVEFHVTPKNLRLQLRIPDTATLRRAQAANVFDEFLVPGDAFQSAVWVQPEAQQWFVHAVIPAGRVAGPGRLAAGDRWHFSFSRYDYTRGIGEPVISSTSPHAVADFHRQQEWGELVFAPAE